MPTTHFPAACPRCETGLRVRREYQGQWVCCQYCGQVFQAKAPEGGPDSPPPKQADDAFHARPSSASSKLPPTLLKPGAGRPDAEGEGVVPADPVAALKGEGERLRAERDEARERIEALEREASGAVEAARSWRQEEFERLEADRELGAKERRALAEELERLRSDRESEREGHRRSLDALREAWDAERSDWIGQVETAREHAERERATLQALIDRSHAQDVARTTERDERLRDLDDLTRDRDAIRFDRDALAAELDRLRAALDESETRSRSGATAFASAGRLPVLARDLERWSASFEFERKAAAVAVVAVPVGPPPLPPSLDDLAAVDRQTEMLRGLLNTPTPKDTAFHTLFDHERFQALKAKLREAALLAERLVGQVDRSRTQKDLLWHLMLAQRNDEMHRKRR